MEKRTSVIAFFCVVWSAVAAIQVDIPQDQYEFARGDNITLPCKFQSALSSLKLAIISWTAGETVILTHYHPAGVTNINPKYQGRVSVDVNINGGTGKADLKLSSITMADNNEIRCLVLIPNDDEGKPADAATLTVLVGPSPPICKVQGKAEYGQNINLTCYSEEGSPPLSYKWESRDVKNTPRTLTSGTDRGILSLSDISKETSGFYICTSSNNISSATCNISLAVNPPNMDIDSPAGQR
ncbi:cell surface A33 antigen-like isoform X2 [Poecilia latipinna]|uniref:cell surface A33 antigen-like isoform X2 n=1 Tax=Poecilia mexicana TaxID=48701 RepID=UPI00072DA772|nr:PREDICTED: cell surface A33 antigen-like isoform X2 [Poecilia mexicana]XP_014903067.1 PREDICTED: cell surface A33 antigen-like isoform X2 [Poecilia latipinna]